MHLYGGREDSLVHISDTEDEFDGIHRGSLSFNSVVTPVEAEF